MPPTRRADPVTFLDPALEAELLSAFLQKELKVVSSGLLNHLEENYFSTDPFRWLAGRIKKGNPPTKELLRIELQESLSGDALEVHQQALLPLFDRSLTFVEGTLERYRDYVAFQIASTRIKSAFENRNRTRSKLWLREVREGVDLAINVFEGQSLAAVDFAGAYVEREKQRKVRRDNPELFTRLRLGIEDFDSQVQMGKGTVTNFLAPFKRYKSVMLCAAGMASTLQGYNTAHVLYENSIELTGNRYDTMFSGFNYDRIVNYLKTAEEKQKIDALMERINGWPHRLKLIKAIPYQTTVDDVERLLERWRIEDGFVADVTIWDYLNLVQPSKSSQEERLRNEQVVWDLQTHAKGSRTGQERVVVCASQAKAEALEVERLGAEHQGKSIGISQAVDSSVAINQTAEERRDGIIVLSPLYLRDGSITKDEIILRSDLARMCISREQQDLWHEVEW